MTQIVEILDADKIKLAIEDDVMSLLTGLDLFDSINSTNTYLLTAAKSGTPSGWVCLAEQQTKGRGRHGRFWFSPRGANIYCSLLWRFPATQSDLASLSLVVAVIVVNVLRQYGIKAGLELKWPNDILFAGRKLAGILLESLPEENGQIAIVIGIGLNLHLPQDNPESVNWIDVAEITGRQVMRNHLVGLLINELLSQLDVYQRCGSKMFMEEWRGLDCLRGKEVIVQTALHSVTGVMQGVDDHGALLLEHDGDISVFQCGEVSVRKILG